MAQRPSRAAATGLVGNVVSRSRYGSSFIPPCTIGCSTGPSLLCRNDGTASSPAVDSVVRTRSRGRRGSARRRAGRSDDLGPGDCAAATAARGAVARRWIRRPARAGDAPRVRVAHRHRHPCRDRRPSARDRISSEATGLVLRGAVGPEPVGGRLRPRRRRHRGRELRDTGDTQPPRCLVISTRPSTSKHRWLAHRGAPMESIGSLHRDTVPTLDSSGPVEPSNEPMSAPSREDLLEDLGGDDPLG